MFTNVIQTLNIELLIDTYRLYQRLAPILYWLYSHYIASTAAWLKTTKHSITCPSVIWHWPCSFFPWALSCFCLVVWLRARWVYSFRKKSEWDWTHLSFNIVHRQSILVSLSIKPWCASKIKPFSWRYRVSLIHMWSVITTSDWSSPHYIHYINIPPFYVSVGIVLDAGDPYKATSVVRFVRYELGARISGSIYIRSDNVIWFRDKDMVHHCKWYNNYGGHWSFSDVLGGGHVPHHFNTIAEFCQWKK